MPRAYRCILRTKAYVELVDVFHHSFTVDPLARVAPMRLKWKPHVQATKAKLCPYPPERDAE